MRSYQRYTRNITYFQQFMRFNGGKKKPLSTICMYFVLKIFSSEVLLIVIIQLCYCYSVYAYQPYAREIFTHFYRHGSKLPGTGSNFALYLFIFHQKYCDFFGLIKCIPYFLLNLYTFQNDSQFIPDKSIRRCILGEALEVCHP